MGCDHSRLLKEDIERLSSQYGFSEYQVVKLYDRFRMLDKDRDGALCKADFSTIPELVVNPIGEHILDSLLFGTRKEINFPQFLQAISVFTPIDKNCESREEMMKKKFECAFKLFDTDNDGFLSVSDVTKILKFMTGNNLSQDRTEEIVKQCIEKFSLGEDKISFEDFCFTMDFGIDFERKMTIKFIDRIRIKKKQD